MDTTEAQATYRDLLKILRESKLGWIADQIAEQVRLGKHQAAPSEATLEADAFFPKARKVRNPQAVETIPFTSREQLEIAVRAIERVLIETLRMEEEVVSSFERVGHGIGWISFEPEEEGASLVLGLQSIKAKKESAEALASLIEELRKELM